jgi:hypothetical protein
MLVISTHFDECDKRWTLVGACTHTVAGRETGSKVHLSLPGLASDVS